MDPWDPVIEEMKVAGHDIDLIPQEDHEAHLWADGLILFWAKNERLPSADELAEDMFDEWDDPVSSEESERILALITPK